MTKKPLLFVTTNTNKFAQAKIIFARQGIAIAQKNIDYDEPKDLTVQEIAARAAKQLADQLKRPVFVDDTGFSLHAYSGFPGPLPKFVYQKLGYAGIFKLLEGKTRRCTFYSALGYCEPGKKPLVFVGTCLGQLDTKVHCRNRQLLAYERVFMPDGIKPRKPFCKLTQAEKELVSQRYKAFRKLIGYLKRQDTL